MGVYYFKYIFDDNESQKGREWRGSCSTAWQIPVLVVGSSFKKPKEQALIWFICGHPCVCSKHRVYTKTYSIQIIVLTVTAKVREIKITLWGMPINANGYY